MRGKSANIICLNPIENGQRDLGPSAARESEGSPKIWPRTSSERDALSVSLQTMSVFASSPISLRLLWSTSSSQCVAPSALFRKAFHSHSNLTIPSHTFNLFYRSVASIAGAYAAIIN